MSKAALLDSILRLDLKDVQQILAARPALLTKVDRQGRNLLHTACTPLFLAVARARNPRLASFLIERGASPEAAPGHALFAATWWDEVKSLELLLKAGARIDIVVGVTPFLAGWGWRRFRAARFLVLHGADVDFKDRRGRTALRLGIEKEYDPALLRWLVKHGASPDIRARDGITPRERASRKRDKRFAAAMN